MKFILNIIIILTIVATLSICAIKPNMHKTLLVFDSAYQIVPEKQIEVEKETIPIMEKVQEPIQNALKTETVTQTKPVKNNVSTSVQKTQTQTATPAKVTKTSVQQKQSVQTTQKTSVTPKTETVKKQDTKVVEKPKVKEVTKTEPVVSKTQTTAVPVKTLTPAEEEIAWNTWRSNLQNKIMQDVKLPVLPTGVVFKFSFSVDKFGKVSNVQTWSTTSTYTPYAIQYIAPVIRSYQGKSILNFPSGTARTTTNVTGGWKISENEKYSTPQDYNDIEKVKK